MVQDVDFQNLIRVHSRPFAVSGQGCRIKMVSSKRKAAENAEKNAEMDLGICVGGEEKRLLLQKTQALSAKILRALSAPAFRFD